jgi:hypothetical protein
MSQDFTVENLVVILVLALPGSIFAATWDLFDNGLDDML